MWFLVLIAVIAGTFWLWMKKNCGCSTEVSESSLSESVETPTKSEEQIVQSFGNVIPRILYFEPSETFVVLEDKRVLRNGHQQSLALTESDMYLKKNSGVTAILQKAKFDIDGTVVTVVQAITSGSNAPVTFVYETPNSLEPDYSVQVQNPDILHKPAQPIKPPMYQPDYSVPTTDYFPAELAGLVKSQDDIFQKRYATVPAYSASRIAHLQTKEVIQSSKP
jgi:hypothetical protein